MGQFETVKWSSSNIFAFEVPKKEERDGFECGVANCSVFQTHFCSNLKGGNSLK